MDCLFCKIIAGEIPSTKVYEDNEILAFKDIEPQAPEHIIIIPKKHITSTNDLDRSNCEVVGKIFVTAAEIAKSLDFANEGYRIVNNCGKNGGQTVGHLHFHLMGGREFTWPAG